MTVNTKRKRSCRFQNQRRAFTRLELVMVLASMAILLCLCLPALSYTRPKSDLIVCANNLRQISNAWRSWGSEHNDQLPWEPPGLPRGSFDKPNAWQHFLVVSNELGTASILACPSDSRRPVRDFSQTRTGLQWPGTGQNNAVSYFVGLDALLPVPTTILSGDRHIGGISSTKVSCNRIPTAGSVASELSRTDAQSGRLTWTNSIHGADAGNVTRADGAVTGTTSASLRRLVDQSQGDGNYNNHILLPF
jgi:type II secretory pathway pseudopilin PulG